MTLLELTDVQATYGTALALRNISFAVRSQEAVALLGRNGMGKTSTMRCLMRFREPHVSAGSILLEGTDVSTLKPFDVARRGLGYVPQGRRVFRSLTVLENLKVVRQGQHDFDAPKWTVDRVLELFPQLGRRQTSFAGRLSGGEQQMLAIGRALMGNPMALLLDEPSEGLAPAIVDDVIASLRDVHRLGVTLLLAEQDLSLAAALCDRFVIVDNGETVMDVDRDTFLASNDLQGALLGLGTSGHEGLLGGEDE
jgi:branched-chain amino acid transport system ATP-binding protein